MHKRGRMKMIFRLVQDKHGWAKRVSLSMKRRYQLKRDFLARGQLSHRNIFAENCETTIKSSA
ncbi:hypothetical protein ARC02_07105 [Stenotrophomonas africana]|nr:hypothetical protein ARC02_07105 [Stenotrophomonas maltophilia]